MQANSSFALYHYGHTCHSYQQKWLPDCSLRRSLFLPWMLKLLVSVGISLLLSLSLFSQFRPVRLFRLYAPI